MNEVLTLALAGLAGGLLGAFFFGGLWWTVRKSLASPTPARWIFASLMTRMSITLAGFYALSGGDWKRLLAALLGFSAARLAVTRLTGAAQREEHHHAP